VLKNIKAANASNKITTHLKMGAVWEVLDYMKYISSKMYPTIPNIKPA
jgi:hypothetical protein